MAWAHKLQVQSFAGEAFPLPQTVGFYHTDVNIVIQTVIQTVGIYHTDVQTVQ